MRSAIASLLRILWKLKEAMKIADNANTHQPEAAKNHTTTAKGAIYLFCLQGHVSKLKNQYE